MSRVFISYRRADSEGSVGRLYDHLCQHVIPEDIFIDVDNILPGQDFVRVIEDTVMGCDAVLAVIGPQWTNITDSSGNQRLAQWDDFVRLEIETALKQDKLVIPVLVQGATMPRPDDLPESLMPLTRRNAITLNHRSFAHDVGRLAEAIQQLVRLRPQKRQRPDTPQRLERKARLQEVQDQVVNFTASPLYELRVKRGFLPAVGEGDPEARIMLVGQAPGENEAKVGRTFIGPSGDILIEMLNAIGLERDDVYMTNIVKDRCKEKDPQPEEIAAYAPFLEQQIEIIQPEVIVPLGGFAMDYLLKRYDLPEYGKKIGKLHGTLLTAQASYGKIYLIPMYHPAFAMYTASKKEDLRHDFEKLKRFV